MGDDATHGRLVVVATPIGNLDDLSPRAADTLRDADLVLAEDTRRTGRLLARIGADVPQLSLHEHNEPERVDEVLDRVRGGAAVALVSDAGTPVVSDPGYRLVAACADAGLVVASVPGPSAVLHALVVAGLPTDRFVFEGFLPRKGTARRDRLAALADEPRTIVLFVAPHRAAADLQDLVDALGPDRPAVVARELTKLHEEVLRGRLADLAATAEEHGIRGEVTVVLGGAPSRPPQRPPDDELVARVRELVATGLSKKAAMAAVADATTLPKREIYQAVVDAGA